jgi:hypothetical protein
VRTRCAAIAAGLVLLVVSPLHAAIGDPLGNDFQVNSYSTGAQAEPALSADGTGGFVVAWQSDGSPTDADSFSVQAKRFTATGLAAGDEFQVNTYTMFPQLEPAVAPDGAGGFVVVWQSGGSSGTDTDFTSIQGRRFAATGTPAGGEFQVNTYTPGHQVHPAVASTGGGFVVVWESNGSGATDSSDGSVLGQRFDAAGAPVGGEFQVNTYTTGNQYDVAVATNGAGGFVVLWASTDGDGTDRNLGSIQAQRFDGTGPVGTQFQVNSYTTAAQSHPAVTSLEGGGFVAVWQSDASRETDTSVRSVQGQRFDAAGAPAGAQFQVNTYTTAAQEAPVVGSDGADGFVVLWRSAGSGGTDQSGDSVQARLFDGQGAPRAADFQVNTYTSSAQNPFAVGADGSGGFVVLWDSLGSSANDHNAQSVQAQRYVGPNTPTTTSSTTPVGPTTTTTTLPFGAQALTARALRLRVHAGLPETSRFALRSKDRSLTLGRGNRSPDDPVMHGGTLTISSSPGGFTTRLAVTGAWKYLGKVGRNKGYKWKSASSPIRKIVIRRGKTVKIAGRGAVLGFDLDANPDPVRVGLEIGGHLYCFEFGGERVTFKLNEGFAAKRAAAPGSCP